MTTENDPSRLIHDPELGEYVRLATGETLAPKRLERIEAALVGQIGLSQVPPAVPDAGPTAPGAQAPVGAKVAAVTGASLGLGSKLALLLVSAGVGGALVYGVLRLTPGSEPPAALPAPAVVAPAPEPAPPPAVEPPALPASATELQPLDLSEPSRPRPAGTRIATGRGVAVPAAPTESSTLPEQLRLYREAQEASTLSNPQAGLEKLRELAQRFPQTPLRPEIEISRLEMLILNGQDHEAMLLLEAIFKKPEHAGRKAGLLVIRGDLLRRQDSCKGAAKAYREAQALGLDETQAEAAARGLKECEPAGEPKPEKK